MNERKAAAMMGIPSKPKFVLSSPALSRRQSQTMLKIKKDKPFPESLAGPSNNSTPSPSKPKKTKTGLASVLHDVADFTNHAGTHFNPHYQDFEKSLAEMLDQFQTQLEQHEATRANAEQMIASFKHQVSTTHASYDAELEELRKWQAPAEKIENMQMRVSQLKSLLMSSKEKLARIDRELTLAEEQSQHEVRQQRRFNGTFVICALVAVVLAYLVLRR